MRRTLAPNVTFGPTTQNGPISTRRMNFSAAVDDRGRMDLSHLEFAGFPFLSMIIALNSASAHNLPLT